MPRNRLGVRGTGNGGTASEAIHRVDAVPGVLASQHVSRSTSCRGGHYPGAREHQGFLELFVGSTRCDHVLLTSAEPRCRDR